MSGNNKLISPPPFTEINNDLQVINRLPKQTENITENINGSLYDLDEDKRKGQPGGRRRSSSARKSSAKKRASRRKPRSTKKRASRRYRHRRA